MRSIPFVVVLITISLSFIQGQDNTLKMVKSYEKIIDDFAIASVHNLSFQNGINTFIEKPESDEDALYRGFRICHTDREYNGGWKLLHAKDIIVKESLWLPFRAILYEYKHKKYIALYRKDAENKYYFRIFNASYTKG